MPDTSRRDALSGGVAALFGTQVFGAGVGIVNGLLLARLLGPAGKGDYYILVLLPATLMVLLQLGLPQAFNFFAARGNTAGIMTKALALTTAMTAAAILGVAALLPVIREAILRGIALEQILFALVAFPLALHATFTTGVLMGRRAVRWYSVVKMAYPLASTLLLIAILGGLGPSVNGAIAVYLIATAIQAVGLALGAARVTRAVSDGQSARYRDLVGYGLRFYPGSLAGFFNTRADIYLIAFLIADASTPIGFYSMAVGLAELVFFFPRAVSNMFFPHVAGSLREESDRQVALVSRVTLLVTGAVAVMLIPVAAVMISLVLPAFHPSLLPLLVLLPGVVALSAANVAGGYLRGIDKPGISSSITLIGLAVNIIANLILIPRLGIVGASAASLVSYSLTSLLLTVAAAHSAQARVAEFWIPRFSDARFAIETSVGVLRRVWKYRD